MGANHYEYSDGITTERLYTRFLNKEDWKLWVEFYQSQEAIELFPVVGNSDEERAQIWVNRQLKRYQEGKYGLQLVLHKETNEVIGQAGLLLQVVDGENEIEIGYHVLHKHWGNGYATEIAKGFKEYCFENGISNSLVTIINRKNIRSQRVALKNGLTLEKETRWGGQDVFLYRLHILNS